MRFLRDDSHREISISWDWWKMWKSPLANNRYLAHNSLDFHSTVLVTVSIQRNLRILSVIPLSAAKQQRHGSGRGSGDSAGSTFVTNLRHCLERYRVNTGGDICHSIFAMAIFVQSCWRSCQWPPLVSPYYIIVLCWCRRLDAVDGPDWALTHLMLIVHTYLHRPTIFNINRLNLARSIRKMAMRIDPRFSAMSDALSVWVGKCCACLIHRYISVHI